MTYAEKLRHPLWQKRRLEIMERDNFSCLDCGEKEKTLNVHHCYYESGLMPWEYQDDALKTYCEECHKTRQNLELFTQKCLAPLKTEDLDDFKCYVMYYAHINGFDSLRDLTGNALFPK